MTNRQILILGLTLASLLLSACLPTQIPQHLPAISPPSLPPITVPTVNAPAIGLTLVNGAIGTPAAPANTPTPVPAVPTTGGATPDAAKWFLYGLVALIGIVIVIMVFARFIRRTEDPNRTSWPDKK